MKFKVNVIRHEPGYCFVCGGPLVYDTDPLAIIEGEGGAHAECLCFVEGDADVLQLYLPDGSRFEGEAWLAQVVYNAWTDGDPWLEELGQPAATSATPVATVQPQLGDWR